MEKNRQKIDWQTSASISAAVLDLLPQQPPFRFIDRIIEIDAEHIIGQYTFKTDEWFYQGHFPGKPMTPGVIMIETMAQTAVVAFGIYLMLLEQKDNPEVDVSEYLTVFTDVNADFIKEIPPGSEVTVKAEKMFWRRRKLKCRAELFLANGDLAATAELAGMGVAK